jgi:hypothetical protein
VTHLPKGVSHCLGFSGQRVNKGGLRGTIDAIEVFFVRPIASGACQLAESLKGSSAGFRRPKRIQVIDGSVRVEVIQVKSK